MDNRYENLTREILNLAGININGANPWDIRVHNSGFYKRAITEAELGIGESYMDGWWDAEQVDEMIFRIVRMNWENKVRPRLSVALKILAIRYFDLQSKKSAFLLGEKHYDLGNDLFQYMLDKRMNYSCAFWKDSVTLDDAQENKLELICRKLNLKPDMRVLDIGCGWGAFGKYAAEKYQAETVGITVSANQVELGRKLCKGLPVEFRLMDYRDLDQHEKFDRIVSVGMFEHVGYTNYKTFFKVAAGCLRDEGLFLLHTIGSSVSVKATNLWTKKYIFPTGMIPSLAQIGKAIENIFIVEDLHNFGADYDKTLMAWYRNFVANWDHIKDRYSERFFRMWVFYLLSAAGTFRSRRSNQLWQIVFSKHGIPGGYHSIR
jgi:cyclopropane-fatty-acyl-phospholipid synthase